MWHREKGGSDLPEVIQQVRARKRTQVPCHPVRCTSHWAMLPPWGCSPSTATVESLCQLAELWPG